MNYFSHSLSCCPKLIVYQLLRDNLEIPLLSEESAKNLFQESIHFLGHYFLVKDFFFSVILHIYQYKAVLLSAVGHFLESKEGIVKNNCSLEFCVLELPSC